MKTVAEQQVSIVLSSHLIADVERVCDYLIVVTASRVRLTGETEALLATHHRLSGPRRDPRTLPGRSGRPVIQRLRASGPVSALEGSP